jgi:putative glutathione S-transferase
MAQTTAQHNQHQLRACAPAGKYSVPVLWDKKTGVIVNNESSEIMRMFNSAFNDLARHPELDLYPEPLRGAIDQVNEWVYPAINNGVYRWGQWRRSCWGGGGGWWGA